MPFRATVSPQDQEWLDARVGPTKRWPNDTAFLSDALLLMRDFYDELDALERGVRRDFIQRLIQDPTTRGSPKGR